MTSIYSTNKRNCVYSFTQLIYDAAYVLYELNLGLSLCPHLPKKEKHWGDILFCQSCLLSVCLSVTNPVLSITLKPFEGLCHNLTIMFIITRQRAELTSSISRSTLKFAGTRRVKSSQNVCPLCNFRTPERIFL